jgi:predicted RNase H-related nuclease YkuK (DUF458 family)
MAINPHHTVEEISGVRCSVIEKGVSPERAQFVKTILEQNNQIVILETGPDEKMIIGVNDITFNLTNALYSRQLKNKDKSIVTPSLWYRQKANEGFYWEY